MGFRLKNWVGFLLLLPLFLLYSCGGGDDSSAPPPPTVTTTTATEITVHTASLNGTVNPNAQATTAVFEWGTDSTLAISESTSAQDIGAGATDQPVNAPITGLALGTTYYYRVVATNASGTQKGTIAEFTTALPNSPPEVTTDAATSVTILEAVLNATVNPNELATTARFEYGTDSALASPTLTIAQDLGAGTTSEAILASLSSLMPGTTYYFRVVASNSAGESAGTILSFKTVLLPPTVTTAAATSITTDSAILNGSVNPNALATTAHFEYGTDEFLASPTLTTAEAIGAGTTDVPIIAELSGLTTGTTYYFRVVATNSAGTTEAGQILSFNNLFFDDFSTDTSGSYTVVKDDPSSTFSHDPTGEQLDVFTGDGFALTFSSDLPTNNTGVFSFDFFPRVSYPSRGGIRIRLKQDADTYYQIGAFEFETPVSLHPDSGVAKFVAGVKEDGAAFANVNNYVSNDPNPTMYPITITFSPTTIMVEAFGETKTLNTGNINVSTFEIELGQQDAYIDNIQLAP